MEVEKERLFQELQKELAEKEKSLAKEVEAQKGENEELKKYVRKREKEHLQSHKAQVKDFTELSRKQQKRRLDTLTTRAQKALWFIDLFGLQFDSLQLRDQKGMKFLLDSSSEQKKDQIFLRLVNHLPRCPLHHPPHHPLSHHLTGVQPHPFPKSKWIDQRHSGKVVDGEKIVFCIGLHKNPEEVTFEDCLKISSFICNLQKIIIKEK